MIGTPSLVEATSPIFFIKQPNALLCLISVNLNEELKTIAETGQQMLPSQDSRKLLWR